MKRSGFLTSLVLIVLITALPASADLTVDVTFSDPDLQSSLGGPNGPIADQISSELAKYTDVPELARGFGNASTYASHASTLRGYQDYSFMVFSLGSMVSVQAPNGDPQFYKELSDDLEDGDVYGGVGISPLVAQAGLNLGFILDGLYSSFILGKYHAEVDNDEQQIDHKENIIGFNVAYQLLADKSILSGMLLWRGLSLQSGLIHYSNVSTVYQKLDEITGTETVTGPPSATVGYTVDPSVDFVIETSGNVIPVEIYTSIRIFYFMNMGVGGGFDYVVNGNTDITLKSAGSALITDDGGTGFYAGETGDVTVDADTSGIESDKFRAKLLVNLGISFGPVFIDVPVSYYLDNGYAVGITAGMMW